jgi:hypothetical protein
LLFTLDRRAGYTFAHVDDVATAICLAYERGRPGERYLISGTPARFDELFALLSVETGIQPPRFEVPGWLLAFIWPLFALFFGKSLSAARELLAMGRNITRFFSSEKAQRELGWRPRSLAEGLRQTVPWFAERERARAQAALRRARPWLFGLGLFDLGLGAQAALWPLSYIAAMHPQLAALHPSAPLYWLTRTGAIWLFFAALEILAAVAAKPPAVLILMVAMLRLMDVPADLAYLVSADDLGRLGRAALMFSPLFNLTVGLSLAGVGLRAVKAGLACSRAFARVLS